LIVFDASSIVSAALKADSIPERALLQAEEVDVFALSAAVDTEIAEVLNRPKFARAISRRRRERFLRLMRDAAIWFDPAARVRECRDPKDDKYLELALASGAETIVSSDDDPYCDPGTAQRLATAWRAGHVGIGDAGHINAASGLGTWDGGQSLLTAFVAGTANGLSP